MGGGVGGGGGGGGNLPPFLPPPLGIFCCITFYYFIQVSWNLVTFTKICLGLIFWNCFFKIRTGFCSVSTFSRTGVVVFCMSSFGKMNIFLTMLVVFESRRFRKNFNFLNNTFSKREVFYKLISLYMGNLIYSWKYLTSMTVLKYDDTIKKVTWPWLLFWYIWKDLT